MTTIKKIKIIVFLSLLPLFVLAQNAPILYNNTVMGDTYDDLFGVKDFSKDGSIVAGDLHYYQGNNLYYFVKISQYDGVNWNQMGQSIEIDNSYSTLSSSVDLNESGNTVVLSNGTGSTSNYMNRYIKAFRYDGSFWEQLGQTIQNTADSCFFGAKLNAGGTKMAVQIRNISNPTAGYDYVRIYEFNGTEWVQSGEDIALPNAGDRVGHLNFSLGGNGVTFSGTGSAQSYVISYQYNGTSWTQKGQILYHDQMESDPYKKFHNVRMSGDASTIAVQTSIPSTDAPGNIYIYSWDTSSDSWIQESDPIIVEGQSEVSISTNGKKIATGHALAYPPGGQSGDSNGEARVFEYDSSSSAWKQIFFYQPSLKWSYVGASVGISGNGKRFAYGSTPEGSPGSVRVYDFIEPTEVALNIAAGADQYIHTGETVQLEAAVLPEDFENQQVEWSVETGAEFVSVNENGLVTGVANGTAVVKAASSANSDVYGSIQIIVMDGTPPEDHTCSQEFAGEGDIANGAAIFEPNGYWAANDFNVEEGSAFTLKNISIPVISLGGVPVTYNVKVYKDANNMPGEEIASFSNLTAVTQSIIQDISYTYLVYSSALDMGEGTPLEGGNKYWIAISASPTTEDQPLYWGGSDTSETEPMYQSTDGGNTWAVVEGAFDGVFTITGICEENLGINEPGTFEFTYFPNPVKNILNIKSEYAIQSVSVFNLNGQKIMENLKTANGQIDISPLVTGTYIVRVTLENGQIETFKILKK